MTDKMTSFKRFHQKNQRKTRSANSVVKTTKKRDIELFKKVFVASHRARTFKKLESKMNMDNNQLLFNTYYNVYFPNIMVN